MMFLSVLPVILAGLLFLLFSQYYLKNWMQSLHICRTELLRTQASVSKTLEKLMALNKTAIALRIELIAAKAELASAIASENPALVLKAWRKLRAVQRQQKLLDQEQKFLIWTANANMLKGTQKVSQKLRLQDQKNQSTISNLFSYRIHSILSQPNQLAVKPDKPDTAPVYELENDFTRKQALHVSWISEFETTSKGASQWLSNHHRKNQSCSASLEEDGTSYKQTLSEAKPSSKLRSF